MPFKLKHGWQRDPQTVRKASGTTFVVGDLLTLAVATGEVTKTVTGATPAYTFLAETAGVSGQTTAKATKLENGQRLIADVTAGTPAAATSGRGVDITAGGVTITNTNNDMLHEFIGKTNEVEVILTKCL